jgi:hypothetical protein
MIRAHNTLPGYIPRQDGQNAIRQDPLADLLGPMQKAGAEADAHIGSLIGAAHRYPCCEA